MKKQIFAIPLLLSAAACSSDPVDIGDDTVRTGENLSDYAASWVGYAEAHTFDGGSDRIRITLDEDGKGTLDVGDAAPTPAATDPDVGYPEVDAPPQANTGYQYNLRSGYAYTVQNAFVEERRLRLGIEPRELFKSWCEMQTSYAAAENPDAYKCLPGSSGGFDDGQCVMDDPETGEPIPVDCGKLELCFSNICDCSAGGCTVIAPTDPTQYMIRFDAALSSNGEELEGTLAVGGDDVTVRLTR